nr:MAG TPA: Protein of unknown function (DUF3043) [Caudoviricetes sp.]
MIIILLIAYLANLLVVTNLFFWILWWFVFIISVLDTIFDILDRVHRHKR